MIQAAAKHAGRGILDEFRDGLARNLSGSKTVRYIKGRRTVGAAPDFIFQ